MVVQAEKSREECGIKSHQVLARDEKENATQAKVERIGSTEFLFGEEQHGKQYLQVHEHPHFWKVSLSDWNRRQS